MPLDQNFYSRNSVRAYPLDDAATHIDDTGGRLPFDVLVDASIRFPSTLGQTLALSSLTVTPNVVTATFVAAADVATRSQLVSAPASLGFEPVAAVTVPQPVTPYVAYPIIPLAAGAAGWVVFGAGISETYTGRFSTLQQAALLPRCAAPLDPLPVTSLARSGAATIMQGVVEWLPGQDLASRFGTVAIDGEGIGVTHPAIFLGLKPSTSRDVFSTYAGTCGSRPESGTCSPPGIDMINTTYPDVDGNLEIVFQGIQVSLFAGNSGGSILDIPTAVSDLCTSASSFADPLTGTPANEPAANCDTFYTFGLPGPAGFTVVSGLFSAGLDGYTAEYSSISSYSVLTRIPPPTKLVATFTINVDHTGSAPYRNGGVIFNYDGISLFPTASMVLLDLTLQRLGIFGAIGYGRTILATTQLDPDECLRLLGQEVQLTVLLADNGDGTTGVSAELIGANVAHRVDGTVPTYVGPSNSSQFGVAAYQSTATFKTFEVGAWASAG